MSSTEKQPSQTSVRDLPISREGRMEPILGRLDLIAALTTILGSLLLGMAIVFFAVIELAKLVSGMWADSLGRWLVIALALAIVWVAARGRKLCIF